MSDIFISYANQDRPRVKLLAEALKAQGWSVWWDRMIPAGKTFDRVIAEALTNARCIVVVWSRHSVNSDWVLEEAEEGRKRGILIPLLMENVTPPMGFRRIQAAALLDFDGTEPSAEFERLVADIANILGSPTATDRVADLHKGADQVSAKDHEDATSLLRPTEFRLGRKLRKLLPVALVLLLLISGAVGYLALKSRIPFLSPSPATSRSVPPDKLSPSSDTSTGQSTPAAIVSVYTQWSMFGYDAQRTNWNRGEKTLHPPLSTKMVSHIENFHIDTLSVADGMLFMTGMEKSGQNKVYAMDALSGKTVWDFTLTAGSRGTTSVTPAYVDVEGLLLFGGQRDDKLYALEARTGALKREWSGMKDMYTRHPALVGQMLYFVGGDTLYGMNVTKGIISWSYRLRGSAQTSPAVHKDIVYVIEKNVLHAVEAATGQQKWLKNVYTTAINYPIAYAGTIYIASEREVSALDAIDASVKWSTPLPAQRGDSKFSLADEVLYVAHWKDANGHGRLYALNADNGTELWHFDTGAEGASVPIVANGVVYLAGWKSRKVFALDARTGDEVWSLELPGWPGNQPVIAYGRLYVTVGGTIYAYGN